MDEWLSEFSGRLWLVEAVDLLIVLFAATAVYFMVRSALVRAIRQFAANTSTNWDDELVKAGVFSRLAQIAPAFVVYYGIGFSRNSPSPSSIWSVASRSQS